MKTLGLSLGFCLLLSSPQFACKSYKDNKVVREAIDKRPTPGPEVDPNNPKDPGVTASEEILPDNTFIVNKLTLPNEVARYDRTCLLLKSKNQAEVVVKDYKLSTPIKLTPEEEYTVSVELYRDDSLIYSNVNCDTNRTFRAVLGRNIFTIPVCAIETEQATASAACSME